MSDYTFMLSWELRGFHLGLDELEIYNPCSCLEIDFLLTHDHMKMYVNTLIHQSRSLL